MLSNLRGAHGAPACVGAPLPALPGWVYTVPGGRHPWIQFRVFGYRKFVWADYDGLHWRTLGRRSIVVSRWMEDDGWPKGGLR